MAQEGWYTEEGNKLQQRYWDGNAWTNQTRPLPPPEDLTASALYNTTPPSSAPYPATAPFPAAPPYLGGLVPPMSQLAVWSMVSSLLGLFCGVGLIVGIVLGFVSLHRFKEPGNNQRGRGMAIAGVVIGIVGIVGIVIILATGGVHFTSCGGVNQPVC
jgi:hypothetical protein